MTSRGANPPPLSPSAAAARMANVKADSDFYASLDYDRARYTEDIAEAACVFLVAVRNGLLSDPVNPDALTTRFTGRVDEPLTRGTKRPATAQPGRSTVGAPGGGHGPGGTPVTSSGQPKPKKLKRSHAAANVVSGTTGPGTGARSGGLGDSRDGVVACARNTTGGSVNASSHSHVIGNNLSSTTHGTNNNRTSNGPGLTSPGIGANTGIISGNNRVNPACTDKGSGGNTSIPPRSEVACRVKEDGNTTWILAKVTRYVSESKKYQVVDSGDEDGLKNHMVFKKHIRVLPKKIIDLSAGTRVLAVYPDTTVFYPATIVGARNGKNIRCMFDDEEEDEENVTKDVDARYVIAL
jgi:SGF29 tudor-like domain